MILSTTFIGIVAGFLTTVAAVPQVYRSWRTRHVRDVSLWQPVLLVTGMIFWLWYGIVLNDLPLIVANIVSLALNLTLIGLKLRFAANDPSPAAPEPIHAVTEET